jgi:5-methylcytosine-specific restriction endonuclease McrA
MNKQNKSYSDRISSVDKEILNAFDRWKQKTYKLNKSKSVEEHKKRRLKAKVERREQDKQRRADLVAFACSASKEKFFSSNEWKKLRFNALQKYRNKCCSCGASSLSGTVLHVDHVKPRSIYPELAFDIKNLQVLCADCNLGKGVQSTRVVLRKSK